jgi:hypothetical protein
LPTYIDERTVLGKIAAQIFDRTGRAVPEQGNVLEHVDRRRRRIAAHAHREVLADRKHQIRARDGQPLEAPQEPVEPVQRAILAEQLLG